MLDAVISWILSAATASYSNLSPQVVSTICMLIGRCVSLMTLIDGHFAFYKISHALKNVKGTDPRDPLD